MYDPWQQQVIDTLKSGETVNYGVNGRNMEVVSFMENLREQGLITIEDMGLEQETRYIAEWCRDVKEGPAQ